MDIIDVAIIGAGPGGLTAALYASRSGLKTVIFERATVGGQMAYTNEIENFPGFLNTTGFDLAMVLENQIKNFNTEYINEDIREIVKKDEDFEIITGENKYIAHTVILALGASPRTLGLESESKLRGSGVSYCATCDGNFYRGADVAVVGGGNTAFEDALFLANLCKKVYIIHRRDEFRAEKVLQDRVFKMDNIEVITNSTPVEITGKFEVDGIRIKNKNEEIRDIPVQGVFVAVGTIPNSGIVKEFVELDDYGYIKTDVNMETSVKGIFAIGDVRNTVLRQIVTACADGAIAAQSAGKVVECKKLGC